MSSEGNSAEDTDVIESVTKFSQVSFFHGPFLTQQYSSGAWHLLSTSASTANK
jgi:hypothetical protein